MKTELILRDHALKAVQEIENNCIPTEIKPNTHQ